MTPDIRAEIWLGGRSMGLGQPDVERHDPGLDPEAEQGEEKNSRGGRRSGIEGARPWKIEGPRAARQEDKEGIEGQGAGMGADQVHEGGTPDLLHLLFGQDEEEAADGHHLPDHQKKDAIPTGGQRGNAGREDAVQEPEPAGCSQVPAMGKVSQAVDGAQAADEQGGKQENRSQAVEPEADMAPRQGPGGGQFRHRTAGQGNADGDDPEQGAAGHQPGTQLLAPGGAAAPGQGWNSGDQDDQNTGEIGGDDHGHISRLPSSRSSPSRMV